MIHELRIYTLHVGKVPEYVKLFEEKGLHVITRHLPLIGWWTSDTGELNRVFHMWRYVDMVDRAMRRKRLYEDEEWTKGFVPLAFPMIDRQESHLLSPTTFSPLI